MAVLNQAQPPSLRALTARVETDWYAFETECSAYVLEVGAIVSGSGRVPVGQAFVAPRREDRLHRTDQDEVDAFRSSQRSLTRMKLAVRAENALGLEYDIVYREASRAAARRSPGLPATPPG